MPGPVGKRRSLLALLGAMVAFTVIVVLGIHATHLYFSQQQKLVEEIRREVSFSLSSLKNNIAPFIESFAANEYANLVENEIGLRGYYAIVVQDFRMGKILGQREFVTGMLRNSDGSLADIDATDGRYLQHLDQAFFKDSADIRSSAGEKIGRVSVYVTDEAMQRELRKILFESLVVTAVIAVLLIGVLLVVTHRLIIHPLRQIAAAIEQRDIDGIPVAPAPDNDYAEVSALTDTMNTMLEVVRHSRSVLQQERRRLANVIDGTNAGTWEWNIQTGDLFINERWAQMLGYSVAELTPVTAETWSSNVHAEDIKHTMALLEQHFRGDSTEFRTELRMRHKDGHWVWILGLGRVIERTSDGQPLLMSGTHIDISAKKEREIELVEQRRRLNDILVGTNVGTWEWNVQSGAVIFNERWAEIIGYTLSELQPVTIDTWMKFAHPDDLEHSRELLEKHFAGELPYYECEARMRHKDGHWVWVLDRGRIAKWSEDGKPLLMSGTHQDISKRKQYEAALVEAKEAAEAADLAKSRFLATMSHEIRTPMNGILGMAQMLLVSNVSDSERRDYARTIMNSGQTLLTLLNDILDLSKIEAGRLELESQAFDPDQLIHEIIALFGGSAQGKGLQLDGAWQGGRGSRFLGDVYRIRQMLSNLVGNAIKFTEHGKIFIEIRPVRSDHETAELEFVVSDTGIGISAQAQAQLFAPFTQADNSTTRKYGGTGLGLSIVRSLARLMEGDVGIESEVGNGSRFWFRIRVGIAAPELDTRRDHRPDPNSPEPVAGSLTGKVLVVEDLPTNQRVIETFLRLLGLDCVIKSDGRQALDAVQGSEAFDLILMDLQMPEMDGFEATQRIRAWEATSGSPRHPIVAITADAFQEDRNRCMAIGMDDFLPKPVNFDDLRAVLAKYLPDAGTRTQDKPTSGTAPIDHEQAIRLLKKLRPLLQDNKFDAVRIYESLLGLGRGTALEPELVRIEQFMNEMRFDQAWHALWDMAAAQDWSLEE